MSGRCFFAVILTVTAILLATGCMNAGPSGSPQAGDPAVGAWVQKGNTSLIIQISPNGSALLRFKTPPGTSGEQFVDETGTWTRTGPSGIAVQYSGPLSKEPRTLNIVFENTNNGYIDSVVAANGTVISNQRATTAEKLQLGRAGSGTDLGPAGGMEIDKSYGSKTGSSG
jgi:hypothetical protein